jgi:pyrroloquinoline quinone biosynthesis protein B
MKRSLLNKKLISNGGGLSMIQRRDFMKSSLLTGLGLFVFPQLQPKPTEKKNPPNRNKKGLMLKVLGTAQDGGFPQMACYCENCQAARKDPSIARKVVSLGLLNFDTGKSFMIEATPDAARQVDSIHAVDPVFMPKEGKPIDGLLLTHADVGHYPGLIQFRPEVTPVHHLPVHCTHIMADFLSNNEPWKFMVRRGIIDLKRFDFMQMIQLDAGLRFRAVKVPHDKHSDMAGYEIYGPRKSLLFIPDIDQWEDRFLGIIASVDYAFLDGTFYSDRRGSRIHPLIIESMSFLKEVKKETSIYFIHFNHSNRVLGKDQSVREHIEAEGFHVADDGLEIWL